MILFESFSAAALTMGYSCEWLNVADNSARTRPCWGTFNPKTFPPLIALWHAMAGTMGSMLMVHWMLGIADTSAVLAFHMSKTCLSRSRLFSNVTANVSCLPLLESGYCCQCDCLLARVRRQRTSLGCESFKCHYFRAGHHLRLDRGEWSERRGVLFWTGIG